MENLLQTRVFISSTMDVKSRIRDWWKTLKLKSALQHVGLLVTLMGYTVAGGLIFRKFEYPAEVSRIEYFNKTILRERQQLIEFIGNVTSTPGYVISNELIKYERILQDSFMAGIPRFPQGDIVKWTTTKAVFFSSTVLTTIGYGNIVPETTEGRAFCIVFALVGIPLTLTVIADWGRLFASTVSTVFQNIPPLPSGFRNMMVARRTSSYALWAVCFLFVYLAAGAGLFVIWEEDWTFFEGFYFCFITMTTIGFGDLVPRSSNQNLTALILKSKDFPENSQYKSKQIFRGKNFNAKNNPLRILNSTRGHVIHQIKEQPIYMLLCTLYILVGLALTSTIIELVRRQYAKSWRQLQALRGPLAENFRKFAENAPGLDVLTFQQDLMKVLTVVTMPRKPGNRKEKGIKQKEWEDAIEAVIRDITTNANSDHKQQQMVQIVIYESSV